jgi:hypothetical protein
MRLDALPSPGQLNNAIRLQIEMVKAISFVQQMAAIPANSGKATSAKPLTDFLTAASAALSGFVDTTAPTVLSRSIVPSNSKRITLVFSEGLDPKKLPDLTDFLIAGQARTVSKVTIDGNAVHVDVTAAFTAGSVLIAYNESGTADKRLQDFAGNRVLSFAATAVTNTLT